jgi:acetyl/propionyl-CoA carboxylase alpha subunit
MNTRLQVEHPVTELVTALDLVRLQIEIAAGAPLAIAPSDLAARGHAMECRVYAEDAERGDLPSAGRLLHVVWPQGPALRVDAGVETGDEVTVDYDPLLAKVIAVGRTRAECVETLRAALRETVVLGVETNLPRLQRILEHEAFRRGEIDTEFLARHDAGLRSPAGVPAEALAAAAAALSLAGGAATASANGHAARDPWGTLGAWRMGP